MEETPSEDMNKQSKVKAFSNKVLKPRHSFSNAQLLSFIGVFAVIGGILLIRSFAFYDPTASVLYHADGNLVQSAGDAKIYLVSGGQRHFVTLDDFRSGRYVLSKVTAATSGDEQLPIGDDAPMPTGVLVQDAYSKNYYVTNVDGSGKTVRSPIDDATMQALGYDPANAQQAQVLPAAQGAAVTSNSAHPDGTKVSLGRSGTFVVDGGQLRPASADVLTSYHLDKTPVLSATSGDKALPKGGALNYADGTLVQGSDTSKIYVIDTQSGVLKKRLIRDGAAFMQLGYDTKDIHKLSDSQLPTADGLPLPESDSAPVHVSVNIKRGQNGNTLSADYKGRAGTTIQSTYKDWVSMTLPDKDLSSLQADPRVASVSGAVHVKPAYVNCNDTGSGPAVPCPQIDSFSANPTTVNYNSPSTLSWTSEYANNCNINGGGVPTTGSQSTGNLTATSGYTLTCNSAQTSSGVYSVTAGAGVTVNPPAGGGGGGGGPNYNSTCDSLKVTLRDNINYGGNCMSTSADQPDLSQITRPGGNWNNAARSLDVKAGQGTTMSLYSGTNYSGTCAQYTVDDSDLSTPSTGPTFNLQAASMKVSSGCPSTPPPPPPSSGCTGSTLANNTPPVVSGTVAVGSTLSSTDGTWCGSGYTLHHYWLDCVDNGPDSRTCKLISGARSATYTIQASDAGYQLSAEVDASNSNASASADSAWTAKVPGTITVSLPVNTALPVISGTLMAGTTLHASTGNWSNSPTSYTYLWMRCNPDVATNSSTCTNVTGATSSNIYTLQTTDVNSNMKVKVTASNSAGPAVATSNPTGTVQAAPTGGGGGGGGTGSSCDGSSGVYLYSAVNYGGTCSKVPANTATISTLPVGNDRASSIKFVGNYTATLYKDANYGGEYSQFSLNHPDLSGFDIGDATTSSVKVTAGAQAAPATKGCPNTSLSGVYLYAGTGYSGACQYFSGSSQSPESWANTDNNTRSVKINGSYTVILYTLASFGGATYQTSTSKSDVTGTVVKQTTSSILISGANIPEPLYQPKITYTNTAVGSVLTTDNGTWSPQFPNPTSYAYQWYRCTARDTTGACLPSSETYIPGATARSYTLTNTDLNNYVAVTVYGKSSFGTGVAISNTVGPVTATSPPPTGGGPIIAFNPTSVQFTVGQSISFSWNVTNATVTDTTCQGTNGVLTWQRSQPLAGSFTTTVSQTTTFSLSCTKKTSSGPITSIQNFVATAGSSQPPPATGLAAKNPGLAAMGWTPGGFGEVAEITDAGLDGPAQGPTAPGIGVTTAPMTNTCGTPIHSGWDLTHDNTVARILAAHDGDGISTGVAGVDTGAKVDSDGFGNDGGGFPCAIRAAADAKIPYINISYSVEKSKEVAINPSLKLYFDGCTAPSGYTLDAIVAAVCYAVQTKPDIVIIAPAGVDSPDDASLSLPGSIASFLPKNVKTITSADEFNGLPPNSPNAANGMKDYNKCTPGISFCGACGTFTTDANNNTVLTGGKDDYGDSNMSQSTSVPLSAAPVCFWLGNSIPAGYSANLYAGYASDAVSWAVPMAAGLLMRGGNLSGGGTVLGGNYGQEIHF